MFQDLYDRLLGSVALRDREERVLGLRHHCAREVVLVDRVVLGRHGPVQLTIAEYFTFKFEVAACKLTGPCVPVLSQSVPMLVA